MSNIQLPDLTQPNYVLSAPQWLMHCFQLLAWSATLAFFIWGVPNILKNDESLWAMVLMGGILLLVSAGFSLPRSFKPMINFACDTKGIYVVCEIDRVVFIPWINVRHIRKDTIIGGGSGRQTGLVIEAKVDDPVLQQKLFRKSVLSDQSPIDEQGYGRIGISNNARSMTKTMHEINHVRKFSGLKPFN